MTPETKHQLVSTRLSQFISAAQRDNKSHHMMRANPSSSIIPLNHYTTVYRPNQIPRVATTVPKVIDTTTISYPSYLDNFPKDFLSTKLLSHLYSQLLAPSKYAVHHLDDSSKNKIRNKDGSLFRMFNPFLCESEESSGEGDDYDD